MACKLLNAILRCFDNANFGGTLVSNRGVDARKLIG